MQLTYLGHSAFHIKMAELSIVIDPFLSGNPQVEDSLWSDLNADFVLLSHGHVDHVLDAETIAKRDDATIISGYEVATHYEQKGCKTIALNHGGIVTLGDHVKAKYVNAVHSSSLPDGSYGGYPGGFVVWTADHCFYFSGDTALTMDMKLIPLTSPKLTFAMLCMGDHFTMGVEDAAIAADFIECEHIVGCHFDTFPPIAIDHEAARAHFADRGKRLELLSIGQQLNWS